MQNNAACQVGCLIQIIPAIDPQPAVAGTAGLRHAPAAHCETGPGGSQIAIVVASCGGRDDGFHLDLAL